MRPIIICAVLALLAGCGTLENRIVCGLGDRAGYVISKYGVIGISTEIAKRDADQVCKGPM